MKELIKKAFSKIAVWKRQKARKKEVKAMFDMLKTL
ncbi:unknown [Clostridium sp. CAG:354]|jgi:hypothetical protein|nr:unknown [Clostridium sp. CAG:354]